MFERVAARLTDAAERFVPDAFVFALIGTIVVVLTAMFATPTPPLEVVELRGKGFWELLPFTLQMALVVITGYVLGA